MEDKADNVTDIDVTDEQADKYIESRGELDLEAKPEEKTEEAPELKEEPKPETKAEEKQTKFVPLEALHEERMRRKELKERLDKQEQRFQELLQKMAPKEEEKPPVFENEVDELKYHQQQIHRSVEEQNRFIQQQRQAAEQQARIHSVVEVYKTKATEYAKSNPAFNDAYKFLLESRKNEYEAAGYSPQQVAQFLQEDELGIVNKALQDEADPADRVYKIAVARGFQPAKKPPEKTLENIDKGLKASKSLSNVSGTSPKGLTLEALAEMSEEEFEKIDYQEIRRLGRAGE